MEGYAPRCACRKPRCGRASQPPARLRAPVLRSRRRVLSLLPAIDSCGICCARAPLPLRGLASPWHHWWRTAAFSRSRQRLAQCYGCVSGGLLCCNRLLPFLLPARNWPSGAVLVPRQGSLLRESRGTAKKYVVFPFLALLKSSDSSVDARPLIDVSEAARIEYAAGTMRRTCAESKKRDPAIGRIAIGPGALVQTSGAALPHMRPRKPLKVRLLCIAEGRSRASRSL